MGYVEGYGDGMKLIRRECEKHVLKPGLPKFDGTLNCVKVTFFAAKDFATMELSERQIKAYWYIKQYGRITTREHGTLCNISSGTARRDLKDLVDKGICKRVGTGNLLAYILVNKPE